MSVTFAQPLWLLAILGALPLVWYAMSRTRTNFNKRQQKLQAGLRAFVLILLALALAQPVIHRGTDRLSIVYLVDASHSVSASALSSAGERISALNAELNPDHHSILAFAGAVVPIQDVATLVKIEDDAAMVERLQRGESAIGPALDAARRALLPGHAARIVLFSDGHATDDSAELALSRLAEQRISVSTYPSAVRNLRDSWVDDVRLEAEAVEGEQAAVIVTMGAQTEARGRLELLVDGKTAASRDISMAAGMADVRMDAAFESAGPRVIEAKWTPVEDSLADNNI